MKARVFISCGQRNDTEIRLAEELSQWFRGEGYQPYVARQVHTFKDLISGLLEALRTCDYYVLINLARERIIDGGAKCRGSLFSHQEFAMALAFDYDHLLILNQSNVHNEGLQGVLVSNIPHFESAEDVLPLVKLAVRDAHWSPQYSRQLQIGRLRWEQKPIRYADHTGVRDQRVPVRGPTQQTNGSSRISSDCSPRLPAGNLRPINRPPRQNAFKGYWRPRL